MYIRAEYIRPTVGHEGCVTCAADGHGPYFYQYSYVKRRGRKRLVTKKRYIGTTLSPEERELYKKPYNWLARGAAARQYKKGNWGGHGR